jgi:hypothetical protein
VSDLRDLETSRFKSVLKELPKLHTVQFCGNYGDPIMGHNFLELVDICLNKDLKIQVHTNGSLRNTDWWSELGKKLSRQEHDIWFGLDGLTGVHEIYRQGTSYDKIIQNATAFIQSGGQAIWQFIPFAHNEHQILEALKTSQKLGFKQFKLVKLFRNHKTVRHWRTGQEFELKPPRDIVKLIRMPGQKQIPKESDCMHLTPEPSLYLNVQGNLSWCCYRMDTQLSDMAKLSELPLHLNHETCIINCGPSA